MAPRATAEIRPLKQREYDAELHCDVLRVIGYRFECGCGKRGAVQLTMRAARAALANHRSECSTRRAVQFAAATLADPDELAGGHVTGTA